MIGEFLLRLFRNDLCLDIDPQTIQIVEDNAPGITFSIHHSEWPSSSSLSSPGRPQSQGLPGTTESTDASISSRNARTWSPGGFPNQEENPPLTPNMERWSSSPNNASTQEQARLPRRTSLSL
ncbi:hypothetical protein SEMRO_295_G110570.1 [Seminavis robusta]|uniref:Uncharacterized protein n=1 Tax=Seminavis robusta TaxID=568900 RepID=A0A9N8HEA7_9STRA|nr:hypothetical protein SEMRO_295_G110570.1 [Seminavis robusta]|eukprot:Sro295_g110570.1 n/a (123) ;mRNA; r:78268-78636